MFWWIQGGLQFFIKAIYSEKINQDIGCKGGCARNIPVRYSLQARIPKRNTTDSWKMKKEKCSKAFQSGVYRNCEIKRLNLISERNPWQQWLPKWVLKNRNQNNNEKRQENSYFTMDRKLQAEGQGKAMGQPNGLLLNPIRRKPSQWGSTLMWGTRRPLPD